MPTTQEDENEGPYCDNCKINVQIDHDCDCSYCVGLKDAEND